VTDASIRGFEPAGADSPLGKIVSELEVWRRRAAKSFLLSLLGLCVCLLAAVLPIPLLFEFTPDTPGAMSGTVTAFMGQPLTGLAEFAVPAMFAWLIILPVTGIWLFRRFGLNRRRSYVHGYKARVLTALCRQHFPTVRYETGRGMPWKLLDESGLFPFASDVYYSEDRFSGRWGDTEVAFAEVVAQRQRRRLTSNGLKTVTETYFQGLMFIADFHKHFHSTTRLIPAGEDGARSVSEHPANFEDPRFEALFQTWTTDQVDVRYVLSSSMLHRFCELNGRFPGLRARLSNEDLLLLLPDGRDRFEPSLFRRADSSNQMSEFVADLRSILAIVDELNLNTRIWSKP